MSQPILEIGPHHMMQRIDHGLMTAAGYAAPWSVKAGHDVSLHLSVAGQVGTVSVKRLDLPGAGTMEWPIEYLEAPDHRAFDQGSYLRVKPDELRKVGRLDEIRFELFLTRNEGARTIMSSGAVTLVLADDAITLQDDDGASSRPLPVPAQTWLDVSLECRPSGVVLRVVSFDRLSPMQSEATLCGDFLFEYQAGLLFGRDAQGSRPGLNGRISRIALETATGRQMWRFPTRLPTGSIRSDGDPAILIDAVNLPTFCTTSVRWDGTTFDPRLAPDQYDAIHLHDDDMGPLDWPASFAAKVPWSAEPGIYAFEVDTDTGTEQFAFFLSRKRPDVPVVFLVPTATYLAYADEALPAHLYEWKCDDRGHRFAVANGLRSLYDYHNDLSGVSICSWRKPKTTLREDYAYPLCGSPHNLPVDLHLLRFCHANGIAFDLLTDHDLHFGGYEALRGYNVVMTGSHPEYMSIDMEDAIRDFVTAGGSLAYLGGNGFAGTVAFKDDLMELRRSALEAGRTWDGTIGETVLSITNEPGGHLRSRGRGEFSLIGGAISLMGFDAAYPFTRTRESYRREYAWLFEGVEDETFGSDGMVLGGAAGYEVDATDRRMGTSPETVVIARAADFPASFFADPSRWYEGGADERAGRRCAEMTIRKLVSGGLIYSASSVAWCGALPADAAMNDVGRITLNLLNRLSKREQRMNSTAGAITNKENSEC